jgi:signal transduction histidine kinase
MSDNSDQLLLDALENERRYTAKELHDGVAQTTLQLGLQAGICRKLLEHNQLEMLASELLQLEKRSQKASGQIRELIQDLRPPALDNDTPSLDDFIKYAVDIHHQRGGAAVSYQYYDSANKIDLVPAQMLGLMRIVQEGLLNIRKHAAAESVRLTVSGEQGTLYLTIADNGKGFDSAEVEARPMHKGGAGLTNLRMRTRAVGGSLTVARDTTGSGTKITVILPE